MKGLSIQQPWVHAIVHEGKDIENRTWQRSYRGWIALHASAKPLREQKFPRGHKVPDLSSLDYSAICGVAKLTAIVTKSRSPWFQKRDDGKVNFGWVLEEVTALEEPIKCLGALSLWEVSAKDFRAIQRQLPHLDFGK